MGLRRAWALDQQLRSTLVEKIRNFVQGMKTKTKTHFFAGNAVPSIQLSTLVLVTYNGVKLEGHAIVASRIDLKLAVDGLV